jgi:hypothetical protein
VTGAGHAKLEPPRLRGNLLRQRLMMSVVTIADEHESRLREFVEPLDG